MSEEATSKPTTAYWIIAGVLLVWNIIGLMFYFQQSTLTPEIMMDAGLTAQQIAHITNTPAWGHSGYAIAVNAGVLGGILLLLRKAWAVPLFVLSLVGALVQDLTGSKKMESLHHHHLTGPPQHQRMTVDAWIHALAVPVGCVVQQTDNVGCEINNA